MNIAHLRDLANAWREEAETLRRRAAAVQAELLESVAGDLDRVLKEWMLEALPLDMAAKESGFSYSTLQQRISNGSLSNAGEKGSPRIRRCDLPTKGGAPPVGVSGKELDLADEVLIRRSTAR